MLGLGSLIRGSTCSWIRVWFGWVGLVRFGWFGLDWFGYVGWVMLVGSLLFAVLRWVALGCVVLRCVALRWGVRVERRVETELQDREAQHALYKNELSHLFLCEYAVMLGASFQGGRGEEKRVDTGFEDRALTITRLTKAKEVVKTY